MPQDPIADLHARNQAALIDFLQADVELGFTFLETARIDAGTDPVHCRALLVKIREALDVIRILAARIDDPDRRKEITERADELEAGVTTLA
jgi:hypothetical protein